MAAMVGSTSLLSLSLTLFSLLALSYGGSQQNVTNKDIDTICSKIPDYSFCWRTIKSNPLATRISLLELANYTINAAISEVNETYKQIGPIIKFTSDESIKQGYELCLGHYYGAAISLKDSQLLLSSANYRTARLLALSAGQEAILCERDLGIAPNEPSPLRERNNNLKQYGSIIWATTNRLLTAN